MVLGYNLPLQPARWIKAVILSDKIESMLFHLILIQMVDFNPFGKIDYVISEYCMFVGRFRRGGFANKAQGKRERG